jgi:Flp pilus assembly protein TadB
MRPHLQYPPLVLERWHLCRAGDCQSQAHEQRGAAQLLQVQEQVFPNDSNPQAHKHRLPHEQHHFWPAQQQAQLCGEGQVRQRRMLIMALLLVLLLLLLYLWPVLLLVWVAVLLLLLLLPLLLLLIVQQQQLPLLPLQIMPLLILLLLLLLLVVVEVRPRHSTQVL